MDIVVKNVLEAIHYVLEHNEFKFTPKQISLADEFIIPFISELNIDSKEFNVVRVGAPKLVNDKRIMPLLIKYFAFIEDNMTLYNELLEEQYVFHENYSIKFYALDRALTGNFKRSEYKKLLFKYEDVVSKFYSSIKGLKKEEKEEYCREFSDIVNIDQTTLKVGYDDESSNYSFLIKRNIELFGKEFLLRLNNTQREIINNLNFVLNEEDVSKIKELFAKYPNYTGNINFSSELLSCFSVDEISSMSLKDSILYEEAIKKGLLERMKSILSLDSNFNCPLPFIRKEIFDSITDEDIVGLTELGKEEILSINIPEIENVIVKPIKKINKIVFKDKKRKVTLEKNDSTGSIKK